MRRTTVRAVALHWSERTTPSRKCTAHTTLSRTHSLSVSICGIFRLFSRSTTCTRQAPWRRKSLKNEPQALIFLSCCAPVKGPLGKVLHVTTKTIGSVARNVVLGTNLAQKLTGRKRWRRMQSEDGHSRHEHEMRRYRRSSGAASGIRRIRQSAKGKRAVLGAVAGAGNKGSLTEDQLKLVDLKRFRPMGMRCGAGEAYVQKVGKEIGVLAAKMQSTKPRRGVLEAGQVREPSNPDPGKGTAVANSRSFSQTTGMKRPKQLECQLPSCREKAAPRSSCLNEHATRQGVQLTEEQKTELAKAETMVSGWTLLPAEGLDVCEMAETPAEVTSKDVQDMLLQRGTWIVTLDHNSWKTCIFLFLIFRFWFFPVLSFEFLDVFQNIQIEN